MASDPQFTTTPNMGTNLVAARSAVANTDHTGATGTVNYIVTGKVNGTRIERINITATAATTAGMIRFFIKDAAGNIRLFFEVLVTAVTPSGTVAAFAYEWARTDGQPITVLPSGWLLGWAPNNAESFDVIPSVAGDF